MRRYLAGDLRDKPAARGSEIVSGQGEQCKQVISTGAGVLLKAGQAAGSSGVSHLFITLRNVSPGLLLRRFAEDRFTQSSLAEPKPAQAENVVIELSERYPAGYTRRP